MKYVVDPCVTVQSTSCGTGITIANRRYGLSYTGAGGGGPGAGGGGGGALQDSRQLCLIGKRGPAVVLGTLVHW
jgi:hypothetical protein